MEATSPWVTVMVAAIAAFGGAPLFTYLAERIKSRAAVQRSDREALDREREDVREERRKLEEVRQRMEQDGRLELRTARGAVNELTETAGLLRGQLESARKRINELEAEIERLREGPTP